MLSLYNIKSATYNSKRSLFTITDTRHFFFNLAIKMVHLIQSIWFWMEPIWCTLTVSRIYWKRSHTCFSSALFVPFAEKICRRNYPSDYDCWYLANGEIYFSIVNRMAQLALMSSTYLFSTSTSFAVEKHLLLIAVSVLPIRTQFV